jgi:hypothetical protein
MDEGVDIAAPARRHGAEDEDIRHALQFPLRRVAQEGRRMLVIGPDRSARLLEVVVLDPRDEPRGDPRDAASTQALPVPVR